MHLLGNIKRSATMFLVDTGSSHNFLGQKLVKSLGLKSVYSGQFKVSVDNDQTLTVMEKCENVRCTIQDEEFVLIFLSCQQWDSQQY